MKRDKLTEKLIRILEALNRETFILDIKRLYVFGSYARGASDPGDLDLLLVYEYPKDHAERSKKASEKATGSFMHRLFAADREYMRDLKGKLRKRGEKIDILVKHESEFENFVHPEAPVKPEDLVLVWEKADRDWKPKISQLNVDPDAGRAPRNHLIAMKRTSDFTSTMDKVVNAVETDILVLTRIPINEIDLQLQWEYTRSLELWSQWKTLGKKSLAIAPYALWWFQQHRQKGIFADRARLKSESMTHKAQLGRLSLIDMLWSFEQDRKLKRQCLIAHLLKKGPNDLLCFERGPNWAKRAKDLAVLQ